MCQLPPSIDYLAIIYSSPVFLSELTTEQFEYQQLARKFGREVIKPAAAEYDRTGEVGVVWGVDYD